MKNYVMKKAQEQQKKKRWEKKTNKYCSERALYQHTYGTLSVRVRH